MSLFTLSVSFITYFHYFNDGAWNLVFAFLTLVYCLGGWFYDIIREATFQGHHTRKVQQNILLGMMLFILSETMLFFSLFWAFFHFSIAPSIWIGGVWPPVGITTINPLGLPLLNTAILLLSGFYLTKSHNALLARNRYITSDSLCITIILGLVFTTVQLIEYRTATFSINDGVYGSIFYLLTGFHGFHVIIGAVFLIVCFIRFGLWHFNDKHHIGYACAIWYWHFVDVVWIIVYLCVYCWGSSSTTELLNLSTFFG